MAFICGKADQMTGDCRLIDGKPFGLLARQILESPGINRGKRCQLICCALTNRRGWRCPDLAATDPAGDCIDESARHHETPARNGVIARLEVSDRSSGRCALTGG